MNWTVAYYNDRVKRDVFTMHAGILADYLRLLDLMQEFGTDLRMPHSRPMGGGLFELRPKGREGIGRVFYCTAVGQNIVVLHSFIKKTQETPRNELRIAQARLKEVKNAQVKDDAH